MNDPGHGEVDALAQHLLREDHVNSEVDARLAAIQILSTQTERGEDQERASNESASPSTEAEP